MTKKKKLNKSPENGAASKEDAYLHESAASYLAKALSCGWNLADLGEEPRNIMILR